MIPIHDTICCLIHLRALHRMCKEFIDGLAGALLSESGWQLYHIIHMLELFKSGGGLKTLHHASRLRREGRRFLCIFLFFLRVGRSVDSAVSFSWQNGIWGGNNHVIRRKEWCFLCSTMGSTTCSTRTCRRVRFHMLADKSFMLNNASPENVRVYHSTAPDDDYLVSCLHCSASNGAQR